MKLILRNTQKRRMCCLWKSRCW